MKQEHIKLRWAEVGVRMQTPWRKELHRDYERTLADTILPERPVYEAANPFLTKARREMIRQT